MTSFIRILETAFSRLAPLEIGVRAELARRHPDPAPAPAPREPERLGPVLEQIL